MSFSVIAQDDVIPDQFDTHYRSVCLFGKARILEIYSEVQHALELLIQKYSPEYIDKGKVAIEKSIQRVCVLEIQIEQMTGKTALALSAGQ